MTDQSQTQLDMARSTLATAQQAAEQATWLAQGIERDVQIAQREYLQTDVAAARQADLQARLKAAIEYARQAGKYTRAVEGAIQARDRLLGQYRHAVTAAENNKASVERDLEKVNLELERLQQKKINCEQACDNANLVLLQTQATFNRTLDEPIALPEPPVAPDIVQAAV